MSRKTVVVKLTYLRRGKPERIGKISDEREFTT